MKRCWKGMRLGDSSFGDCGPENGQGAAHGTGVEGIEEVVKKMRVYSGVEGEFQVGSWLEKYGVLVAVLLCGVLIFILKKSRERRKQE